MIADAVSREQLAGDGHFTKLCEDKICQITSSPFSLLTHSCTAALEMAALLLNVGVGDEVIMPSYTFVSTANAVVLRGATPVFVDVRPDTLNLDETKIETAVTENTKAIFVVHYAGVPCEMDAITAIARKHDLFIVEDAAQALTSSYKGRRAGSMGDLACFSFHETKNIISGEGGALTVNSEELIERAEIIREKGTNRKKFFKGQVDKYTWVDVGSSFLPGELIAAFLYGQLDVIDQLQRDRLDSWERYDRSLAAIEGDHVFSTPFIPEGIDHNAHMYYILVESKELRGPIINQMREMGIATPFHYVPLHSSPAGKKFARASGDLEVTNSISDRILRLPMYPGLKDDQSKVIEAVSRALS